MTPDRPPRARQCRAEHYGPVRSTHVPSTTRRARCGSRGTPRERRRRLSSCGSPTVLVTTACAGPPDESGTDTGARRIPLATSSRTAFGTTPGTPRTGRAAGPRGPVTRSDLRTSRGDTATLRTRRHGARARRHEARTRRHDARRGDRRELPFRFNAASSGDVSRGTPTRGSTPALTAGRHPTHPDRRLWPQLLAADAETADWQAWRSGTPATRTGTRSDRRPTEGKVLRAHGAMRRTLHVSRPCGFRCTPAAA